jgi:inner membrane protein
MLISVYTVLYLTLKSTDYALLAGSTLTFAALAATMWLTRNEEWGGAGRPRLWRFRKPSGETAAAT